MTNMDSAAEITLILMNWFMFTKMGWRWGIIDCIKNDNIKEMRYESEIFGIKWRLMLWQYGEHDEHEDVCLHWIKSHWWIGRWVSFDVLALYRRFFKTGIFYTDGWVDINWGHARVITDEIKELNDVWWFSL